MSSTHHAQQGAHSGNTALYESGRMHYVKGYVPDSLAAPHSSLLRIKTWLGMGLILTSLAPIGTAVFGGGSWLAGTQEHWAMFLWGGIIATVIFIAAGAFLIHSGRSEYRKYRAETGRLN